MPFIYLEAWKHLSQFIIDGYVAFVIALLLVPTTFIFLFCFFLLRKNQLYSFTLFSLGMSPLSKYDRVILALHLEKLRQRQRRGFPFTKEAVNLAINTAKEREKLHQHPAAVSIKAFLLCDEVEVQMPPSEQRLPLPGGHYSKEPGCFSCSPAYIPPSLLCRAGDEWEERGSEWTLFSIASRC